MPIPKKPKDVEEFIKNAKANEEIVSQGEPKKNKKFLIELPYELWMKLKLKALQENKPLKDVILEILQDSVRE